MSERIVVSCRMDHAKVASASALASSPRDDARGYLEHARALTQRAEALGATLASWSATTLGFAWDTGDLEEAIAFVKELHRDSPTWACGIAQGMMEALADKAGRGRADLAWGPPLVAAVSLARVALPGEVLVDASVRALDRKELVTIGRRVATDAGQRVRAVRLDVEQPWRKEAAASVERVVPAKLLGRPDPASFLAQPGVVHVVRADPGLGGTRLLAEIAARVAPGPCITVMPSGASVEPLGALRRALVRALSVLPYPDDAELAPQLDMFLGGIGASVEAAAAIVAAILKPTADGTHGALFVDDAGEVDAESLEACAHLIAWSSPFHVVMRVDATDVLPSAFADLPRGSEIDLEPLGQDEGVELARGLTAGALSAAAAKRWARRGGFTPLGVVEAVQYGLTNGELAWIGDRAYPRTRVAGRGKARPASHWIGRRAKSTAPDERGVLATVALFGGEVSLENAQLALHAVDAPIVVKDQAEKLLAAKWLVETEPGWVALPTRTHRDTIAELLDEEPRRALHRAIAEVLEQSEGELGCAEAAHHAAKAGDGERAARLALRAARAASAAGMTKSANRLLTLARLADPKCEPLTRRALASSLPPALTVPGARPIAVPAAPRTPPPVTSRVEPRSAARAPVAERDATDRAPAMPSMHAARTAEEAEREPDSRPTLIKPPASLESHEPLPPPILPPVEPDRERALVGVPSPPPARRPTPPARPSSANVPLPPRPPGVPPPVPSSRASAAQMPAVRPPAQGPASRAAPAVPPPLPPRALASPRPSTQAMPAVGAVVASSTRLVSPPAPASSGELPRGLRPAADAERTIVNAPPSAAAAVAAAKTDEPEVVSGRLTALAKAALLGRDAGALERWSEGLRATGEHERFAERMEAMARLSRGQIGDALRVLKKARDDVNGSNLAARTQASLALGVALAAAGRADEALLEGLDALARAREKEDARAAYACLAFLAKLFASQDKADEAARLRGAAKVA